MDAFLKFIRYLNIGFLALCKVITIGIMATLVVIVVVGAFYRYVLNDSLAWTEEIGKFLLLYLTFIGAPIGLKQGIHAAIDTWIYKLPPLIALPFFSFIHLMIMTFCVVTMKLGTSFAINASIQTAPYTQIGMNYIFIAIPIGAFFIFMVSVEQITEIFTTSFKKPQKLEIGI